MENRNFGGLQQPALTCQIMPGKVISVALVTGIKSDLPCDIISTVTESVYDTASGHYPIDPARLVHTWRV